MSAALDAEILERHGSNTADRRGGQRDDPLAGPRRRARHLARPRQPRRRQRADRQPLCPARRGLSESASPERATRYGSQARAIHLTPSLQRPCHREAGVRLHIRGKSIPSFTANSYTGTSGNIVGTSSQRRESHSPLESTWEMQAKKRGRPCPGPASLRRSRLSLSMNSHLHCRVARSHPLLHLARPFPAQPYTEGDLAGPPPPSHTLGLKLPSPRRAVPSP